MIKYALLAATALIATPAFAQDAKPAQATPATQAAPMTPATPTDQTMPAPADPMQAAPTPQTQPATATAQPTPADPTAAPADPATATAAATPAPAAQPATSADQVAQVVSGEFGTYDKDANGSLNKAEFSTWMTALQTASNPSFKSDSAAGKTWLNQAFAKADTDKNASISQAELAKFLVPNAA